MCQLTATLRPDLLQKGKIRVKQTKRVKEEDVFPLYLLAKAGDKQAYNRLFEILALLIRKTVRARNYFPTNQIEDITQSVITDMVRGYRNYNVDRGRPFLAFAQDCIKKSIVQAWRTFWCPTHQILSRADSLDAQLFKDNKKKDVRYIENDFSKVLSRLTVIRPSDFTEPGSIEYWTLIDLVCFIEDSYSNRVARISKIMGEPMVLKQIYNARDRIKAGSKEKQNIVEFLIRIIRADY